MKIFWAAILGIALLTEQASAADKTALKNEKDKVSYSIGMQIGSSFKNQSIDVDADVLIKGIKDAISGAKPLLSEREVQETMTAFQNEMKAKQAERMKVIAEKNKKEGETFLAENKKKGGVKNTASGLQYKIVKDGNGKKPTATDTVTVNYRGTLIDGTEFDSSYKRGEPASFPVNQVIAAWTEALQLMSVGSKWQLFISPNLAYGERGMGAQIGPNATLVFEVELLSIK
ncbi:MAG: FKBP-type peptidyl-prolyl cis-trans isomerase [Deltaproteobacteria bacterium]|nr:FKBP-type peptidyl-prolyl cis-trans isomerase [Deltaproteobacteria bacterium]